MELPFALTEPKVLILLLALPPVIWLGLMSARARPRDRARIQASIVVRVTVLLLIILALAGLQWVSSGGPLNVVFLVDESASVSRASQDAAIQYVKGAIASMGPKDRAGVVLFGEQAIVDRAVSGSTGWAPIGSHPSALATNIAEALQVGAALFPEGGARRLVLLSDGAETAGKARELAQSLSAAGVQISVVPIGGQAVDDVAVDQVLSPDSVAAGQQYDARVLIKSTAAGQATVRLFDGADPAGEQTLQLAAGDNVATFPLKARTQGFHVITARVAAAGDLQPANNEASSFTIVRKPPSVLIVAASPADGEPLRRALEASDMQATLVAPAGIPLDAEHLDLYDAVVLANVSSQDLGQDTENLLQSFVRDQGHGLLMIGGDVGYGAGGFQRTPIEELLPVSMDVRTSQERASIAMTFVIDKSGSMGRCHCGTAQQFSPSMRTEFGVNKLDIVKQAVAKAATLLNSSDQVGVVAFDQTPSWLVPLEPLSGHGQQGISQALQPIQAEGNTSFSPGLQAAIDGLSRSTATLKHIVFLSDGWTRQGNFSSVLTSLAEHNITMSTVGVGDGPGEILKLLAEKGGGQYYAARDTTSAPDMLLRETVRLTGFYYVEKAFSPSLARASPMLNGFAQADLPKLLGYNATTAKPAADVVLRSPSGDPILAEWQYGLGRSVAWTSDAKGRWATDWVQWPRFAQFAGQMVGWTLPRTTTPGIETTFSPRGSTEASMQDVAVQISSTDAEGSPRNLLRTTMVVTGTNQPGTSVAIAQEGPGQYGGLVSGVKQGVYQVRIDQIDPATGQPVASQQTGLVVPYPSEFKLSSNSASSARNLLDDLAQLGGGHVLDIGHPQAAFVDDIPAQKSHVDLWSWLLVAAILLFPLDVAIRRLTFTRSELRQAIRRRSSHV